MVSPHEDLVRLTLAHPVPGWAVAHVEGELDADTAPELEDRLFGCCDGNCPRVVIDLEEVLFIDSTGIRVVMQMVARARPRGTVVVVPPRRHTPRRALQLLRIDRACAVADSVEEALTLGRAGGALKAG